MCKLRTMPQGHPDYLFICQEMWRKIQEVHPANSIFITMKTTIDQAGRLAIPKDIRRESGIKPGMPLEVRREKGAIAITPAPLPVKLERKGRLLVAVPAERTPRLSADTVERTRKRCAKNGRVSPLKHGARFSSGYKLHDCGGMLMA